jgi:hypothetical protein
MNPMVIEGRGATKSFGKRCSQLIIGFVALVSAISSNAEISAIPMPGDTKLVIFTYDANDMRKPRIKRTIEP